MMTSQEGTPCDLKTFNKKIDEPAENPELMTNKISGPKFRGQIGYESMPL